MASVMHVQLNCSCVFIKQFMNQCMSIYHSYSLMSLYTERSGVLVFDYWPSESSTLAHFPLSLQGNCSWPQHSREWHSGGPSVKKVIVTVACIHSCVYMISEQWWTRSGNCAHIVSWSNFACVPFQKCINVMCLAILSVIGRSSHPGGAILDDNICAGDH